MFLPGRNIQQELQEKQRMYRRVEELATCLIPPECVQDCTISVQEVQCGDPTCAPIDTLITVLFSSGGQGVVGLPMEAKEVTPQELETFFPPADIIEKWHRGEEAEWPPRDEDAAAAAPAELRFEVGTPVLCRVGQSDWLSGRVTQLWYREAAWPEGAYAPYKIRLLDGRDIFAPADMDQIIKLDPDGLPLGDLAIRESND